MTAVIKAIGILLLQIIIYYLFGTIFELFCRKKHGVVFKEISGFLVYQVLFQICALPMIKADQTLARLAVLWGVIVITCWYCNFLQGTDPRRYCNDHQSVF